MSRTVLFWGDRLDDDITKLPKEWEARVSENDRVYFVNHNEKKTQWEHPTNGLRYKVPIGLPYGWQKFKDKDDCLVYVDHYSQMSSFVDPRLMSKAVYDFPRRYGIRSYTSIRNVFRSLVKASQIVKDVDLQDKVAIITGANSGLDSLCDFLFWSLLRLVGDRLPAILSDLARNPFYTHIYGCRVDTVTFRKRIFKHPEPGLDILWGGYQTALHLASCGARVILACRNAVKAEEAVLKIKHLHPQAAVESMALDLASLVSVKNFAEEFTRRNLPLHILVCNAGIMGGPFGVTVDGIERHFAVNHIGHFYLAQLLLPVLKQSKPSRVVVVSSESHWYPSYSSSSLDFQQLQHPSRERYSPITAYGSSKLCNILFALEFHRRYVEEGVCCNAVHPGNLIPTNLSRGAGYTYRIGFALARPFTKSVAQAASTILYCAAHPSMKGISGLYMYECWPVEPSPEAQDTSTAIALWELSEQIISNSCPSDSAR